MARQLLLCAAFLLVQTAFGLDLNRFTVPADGKMWVLLVAGSNTYDNYRHQADICHAYQIISNHGIPDEQIVVMMYDDIAQSERNPTKGIVINKPNGKDVYKGVLKDYTKDEVTPQNFLNVLQGKKDLMENIGSGKVIKSGPNDHVFVYFADHGAPGLVAFPEGELYAKDLNSALRNMHKNKQFGKMVIYIEACESGSMFLNLLPKDINIFATTAANDMESSYACYWDEKRETYLGDVYSVKWMEDSDSEVLTRETLQKQFEIVKKETNTSHVQEFGDLTIAQMKVSEFQGQKTGRFEMEMTPTPLDAVPSHEVPIVSLKRRIVKSNSFEEQKQLKKQLKTMLRNRDYLLNRVKSIVQKSTFTGEQANTVMTERFELRDFECYEQVARHFSANCFSISKNAFAARYMYTLVNLCETGIHASRQKEVIDAVCVHPPIHGIV